MGTSQAPTCPDRPLAHELRVRLSALLDTHTHTHQSAALARSYFQLEPLPADCRLSRNMPTRHMHRSFQNHTRKGVQTRALPPVRTLRPRARRQHARPCAAHVPNRRLAPNAPRALWVRASPERGRRCAASPSACARARRHGDDEAERTKRKTTPRSGLAHLFRPIGVQPGGLGGGVPLRVAQGRVCAWRAQGRSHVLDMLGPGVRQDKQILGQARHECGTNLFLRIGSRHVRIEALPTRALVTRSAHLLDHPARSEHLSVKKLQAQG